MSRRPHVRVVYCMDTSSFIYCQRSFGDRATKREFYRSVWDLLDGLASDGRLIAPHRVKEEICRSKDHLAEWAETHSAIFRPNGEYVGRVIQILRVPGQRLVQPNAPRGAEEADPWVIALAEGVNATAPSLWMPKSQAIVVSEETKPGGIRDVCAGRGVEHMDFTEMLQAEGVSLVRRS